MPEKEKQTKNMLLVSSQRCTKEAITTINFTKTLKVGAEVWKKTRKGSEEQTLCIKRD
jgi:hypothetical protein